MNRIVLAASAALLSGPALAHHPMGGETPATLTQGLLSGIGHPVIGLDHLAFVIAVGVAAVALGSRFLLPLAFIGATIAGTLLHVMAIGLPAVETMIALSVLAIGALLFTATRLPLAGFAALFALSGLFHGHAYGEAVFGAEATPLLAYLAGFGVTQYAVAVLAGSAIVAGFGRMAALSHNLPARLTGAFVAGMGFLLVGEKAIAAVFAG